VLRWIIRKKLDSVERDLGESADYLRFMVDASLPAFLTFTKVLAVAEHRRKLPADAHHVARLVATRDADCGTCVRVEIRLAKKAGVPLDVIRAVIGRAPERLPERLADVYRFTESVVTARYDEARLRERIRTAYGDAALVELALGIAACRVFPTVKRALGYATSCSAVDVEAAL
jgi:alkylhydroperoxidase family enzyme